MSANVRKPSFALCAGGVRMALMVFARNGEERGTDRGTNVEQNTAEQQRRPRNKDYLSH
jgi:hypothetical protein